MIQDVVLAIISLFIQIVHWLLIPIDNIILSLLPNLETAFVKVGELFNLLAGTMSWVVSLTGLSNYALSLIVTYYIFKLTAPLGIYFIKVAIQWWGAVKG